MMSVNEKDELNEETLEAVVGGDEGYSISYGGPESGESGGSGDKGEGAYSNMIMD